MKKLFAITSFSLLLSTASSFAATTTDPLIEGAKQCTRHMPRYEREYGIPTHLLSAIASTESGRFHQGLRIAIPWPWTINANGKGYYFNSKSEAIAAARNFRAHGIKSMDVGCMQVNLMHHPEAFASLEQAFEPQNNIAYAASFLRNLYEEDKSWKNAASSYHSKTPKLGREYVGNVYDNWYTIVSRLREAKLQAPAASSFAQNDPSQQVAASAAVKKYDPATRQLTNAAPAQPERKIAALPEQRGTTPAAFQPARMNSIKVTRQEDKREKGIIVVRPEIKVSDEPVPSKMAANEPNIIKVAQSAPSENETKIIRLDNAVSRTTLSTKSEPRFIFNN